MDKIDDEMCGTDSSSLYNKMSRGGGGPCTKFCATCETSYDMCKADKDSSGSIRNVVSCDEEKAIICRYDVGTMSASDTCKSHGGDDNTGSAGCPSAGGSSSAAVGLSGLASLMLAAVAIACYFLVN